MSLELGDGTIVPSYFNKLDSQSEWTSSYYENSLRVGRIIKAYSASDSNNLSKKNIEYDVETAYSNGDNTYSPVIFHNVQVASLFGGIADFFRWTPRISNPSNGKNKIDEGSRVLLLCVNGISRNAYIIGGVPHSGKNIKEKFEDNHYLEFEFNGVYSFIDKEGTFSLVHRGATDPSGKIKDESGKNSSITFVKDGSITIGYSVEKKTEGGVQNTTEKLPLITWDKPNKKLLLFANSDISSETQDKFLIKTTSGVKINDGGIMPQAFLRATIYRQQEGIMHNTINPLLATLSGLISGAGSALTGGGASLAAGGGIVTAITPFHLIPVAGPIIGAALHAGAGAAIIAGGVSISAAGTLLTSAGPLFASIQAAILAFEALSSQYLSTHHFHSEDPLL